MMQIHLDMTTQENQVKSMHDIADQIEKGLARVIDVGTHPQDSTILVFYLQGVKLDG
jgi:hypothetical protein